MSFVRRSFYWISSIHNGMDLNDSNLKHPWISSTHLIWRHKFILAEQYRQLIPRSGVIIEKFNSSWASQEIPHFFILIPCIMDYVEINQPNELKLYSSLFFLTMAPTCFGRTMPSSGSDYGIVLPKHVGAIVRKNKELYNFSSFGWLISTSPNFITPEDSFQCP
jgi:hypothetical protein